MECPQCHKDNPDSQNFCGNCGHDLPISPRSTSPTLSASGPPHASTGERRQATVLFSDLSGYTTMNEKLDPEEVEGIMSRSKAEAVKIVERGGKTFGERWRSRGGGRTLTHGYTPLHKGAQNRGTA